MAREFKRRGLPLSVIVADFFHWPNQGDWKFDEEYWPDPAAMTRELGEMGVQLMVSVWPTVEKSSENHQEMLSRGLLVRMDRGIRAALEHRNHAVHFDATNPEARAFVWDKVRRNYLDKGVSLFWLDEAEPEYTRYDFDIFRYHLGTDLQVGNIYPALFAKTFYDGLKASGVERPLSLVRCAWAGSQRYGALVWSGDIHSTFESLRNQLAAGLNMGMAGIPWWTTDIGGFHGGDPEDPAFRELLTRWFQWGVFCPVMRIHGDREPTGSPLGPSGGGKTPSGPPQRALELRPAHGRDPAALPAAKAAAAPLPGPDDGPGPREGRPAHAGDVLRVPRGSAILGGGGPVHARRGPAGGPGVSGGSDPKKGLSAAGASWVRWIRGRFWKAAGRRWPRPRWSASPSSPGRARSWALPWRPGRGCRPARRRNGARRPTQVCRIHRYI